MKAGFVLVFWLGVMVGGGNFLSPAKSLAVTLANVVFPENIGSIQKGALRLQSHAGGVNIHVRGRTLFAVLEALTQRTGLRFRGPDHLLDTTVRLDIQAADWEAGLEKILEPFSWIRIGGYAAKGGAILLLGPKGRERPSRVSADSPGKMQEKPRVISIQRGERSLRLLAMLPAHILREPRVVAFIKSRGLEIPPELETVQASRAAALPPGAPLPPYVSQHYMFKKFLQAAGLQPPKSDWRSY